MKKLFIYITVLFALLLTNSAQAAVSPLGLAVVPPVQFPPDDFNVAGLRASVLFGDHRDVYGLDLGLIGNITRQEFAGIALSGVFNLTHGEVTAIGLQAAPIANVNHSKVNVIGIQLAAVNYQPSESSVNGLQFGGANLSDFTTIRGLQVGIYNSARQVYGFQIGLVNKTTNLTGIQIGLVNFYQEGLFKISPILNAGF